MIRLVQERCLRWAPKYYRVPTDSPSLGVSTVALFRVYSRGDVRTRPF